MKVLYVDITLDGHHIEYLKNIISEKNINYLFVPSKTNIRCEKEIIYNKFTKKRTFFTYLKWMKAIKNVCIENQIDIVHFLDGDSFRRYFGIGLKKISSKSKVFITYHHFFEGKISAISYKMMMKRSCIIVHSDLTKNKLLSIDSKCNVNVLNYPSFIKYDFKEKKYEKKILLFLGTMRNDKGLDIFLDALKLTKYKYDVFIAGKNYDYDLDKIIYTINSLNELGHNISYEFKILSDEEMIDYLIKTNVTILPYRKCFQGASGILVDSVKANNFIISSNTDFIGKMTEKYNLGAVFDAEDSASLATSIDDLNINESTNLKEFNLEYNLQKFKDTILEIYKA